MFKNHLISTLRFLKRNKIFTGINILGLSLALAASFIILLFVINELSYNSGFKNRKQIYRVLSYYADHNITDDETSYVLAKSIKEEFPQVRYVAPISRLRNFSIKLKEELIPLNNAVGTDSEIFQIFDIPIVGQTKNILADPNSIVLSSTQAQMFFQGEDPIGKDLIAFVNDKEEVFVVKGIFDDMPVNSNLQADCFISSKWPLEQLNLRFKDRNAETDWRLNYWETWLLLDKNADRTSIDKQFRELEKKVHGEVADNTYFIQNLTEVYLGSQEINSGQPKGSIKNIRIFSSIALLIIIIAALNYIILSTAVSTGRSKEIGIRKTHGASSQSIQKQLLNESIIMAMMVLPFALFLSWLVKPYAEELFQTKLLIIESNIIIYAVAYLALTLFIGLASGLYTSSFLSKLNVINIFKNSAQTGKSKSYVRLTLIVIQLIIFCSFVSGTLIIRSQYKYALEKDPGYRNKDILFINVEKIPHNSAAFLTSIKTYPNVISAGGATNALPMLSSWPYSIELPDDKSKKVSIELLAVDYDFVETMGIEVLEGRSFSREFGSDGETSYLLNEKAVEALGLTDPIEKKIDVEEGTVIGVVKDFNLHSFHSDIPPLLMVASDAYVMQVAVHYKPGTLGNLLPLIKTEWEKVAPDQPFNYKTIEEFKKEIYTGERNLSVIISFFALFSMLIASFGLFGLTLYMVKSQTKEIGIKKVFGSSEKSIVLSLLRENMVMVAIATVLSVPPTILVMNRWLTNFSYKVDIGWWVFALTFLLAAFVVLLNVFYHSYRASQINPIEALRYE